ncbi:transcriptional regulator [Pseudomonas sp. GM84]|uniref:LysR family transcriptional regulator n=1 Tax=Pseudomonas sp. GM84 TaxID=1144340 RepID=UPI00026F4CC0|nr:LysR family transcriptional regulator [Pseudomonas sp. GM84]EJN39638.1 transcriptional regulator [Pseudomonas sp. GM84]
MQSKDLQIDWLQAFVAIVDSGSVTAAARQIHRSQSAVSMQLKKLETSVGRQLLVRGPHSLSLTPAGYDLLTHARRLLEYHAATLAALHGGHLSGRVSFGVSDDYARRYAMPVLGSFAARHSEVEITVVCEQSTSLIAKVERGQLDLALVCRDRPHRGTFLFKEPLVWAASRDHQVWLKDPVPIALHEVGGRIRTEILNGLSSRQRNYRVVYNSPNIAGQLTVASAGLAVIAITRCAVDPELEILGDEHGLPPLQDIEMAILRSEESGHSRAVSAFYSFVIDVLRDS